MTDSKITKTTCTWADAEVLFPGIEVSWRNQSPGAIDVRVEILSRPDENVSEIVVSEVSYTPRNIQQWARCSGSTRWTKFMISPCGRFYQRFSEATVFLGISLNQACISLTIAK